MTKVHEDKETKSGEMSNAEKLEIAIKREKLRKARRAVNASLDGSFGKLKKRRFVSTKKHTQSFVLRQASALELKNRAIAVELAKTRQYCSQLERVNYCLKEKHLNYAMKLTSLQSKLQKASKANKELERQAAVKDELLLNLQNQLSTILRGIAKVQTDCRRSGATDQGSTFKPQRILQQTLDAASSDEESLKGEEKESDMFLKKASQNSKKFGTDMSVLKENESSSTEDDSSDDESESDEEIGVVAEDFEELEGNEDRRSTNGFDKTNADLRLQVSFSSVASSCHSDDENKTSHTMVSMELTSASTAGVGGVDESDLKDAGASEPIERDAKAGKAHVNNSAEILKPLNTHDDETTKLPEENIPINAANRQFSHKAKTCKTAKMKQRQNRTLRDHNKDKAIFDFLSASSDSFVCDPNKKVKLNSSKSFSPVSQKYDNSLHRASDPGTIENDDLSTRRSSRRRAGPTSYAEPSLNVKLRRGDKISDGTLQSSFSPKKKKEVGKKKRSMK